MNPALTVIKMVNINCYSFYVKLLYSCMYSNKSCLIDVDAKESMDTPDSKSLKNTLDRDEYDNKRTTLEKVTGSVLAITRSL